MLTRNEVDLHKIDYPANALGVVRNIKFHVHKDAPPPLWGLSASLTAIALLPACGTNGLTSGKTSTHAFGPAAAQALEPSCISGTKKFASQPN